MSGQGDIEALAYVIDALRRQEVRHRQSGWPVPAGVSELVEQVGFRVSRGLAGSRHDIPAASPETPGVGPQLLVNYATAARSLEVSVSTIKRLVKAGDLHPVHIGGAARLKVKDLEQYADDLTSSEGVR